MRRPSIAGFALVAVALLVACQPRLNWREVSPEGSGAQALFPCKPEVVQRPAAGDQGAMGLAQCEAGDARFSLSWADAGDAAQVGAALQAMSAALAQKLKVPLPPGVQLQVPGMTPHAQAAQHHLRAPGMSAHAGVFAHGTRVYQALMTGPADDAAAWEGFVAGLRVGSAAAAAR